MGGPPPMSDLRGTIDARLAELDRLNALLADVVPAGACLPHAGELDRMSRRLRPVLAREFHPLRAVVKRLGQDLDGIAPDAAWERLERITAQIDALADNVVAYVEGALARAAGTDKGLCAISDHLLDDISRRAVVPWERTSIPSARDATSTRTWVVGLRLHGAGIWFLPMMVHELGHFATERLESRLGQRLAEDLLGLQWATDVLPHVLPDRLTTVLAHPHELFADVFATYTLGPAYAAALVERATPHRPSMSRDDHPAWEFRVHAVLQTLRRCSGWADAVRPISARWRADVAEAGPPTAPCVESCGIIDAFVDRAIGVLEQTAPDSRFVDPEVLDVERDMLQGAGPRDGVELRTVLNAAWVHRLRWWLAGGSPEAVVGDQALAWCHHIVGWQPWRARQPR